MQRLRFYEGVGGKLRKNHHQLITKKVLKI